MKGLIVFAVALVAVLFAVEAQACDQLQLQGSCYAAPLQAQGFYAAPQQIVLRQNVGHYQQPQQIIIRQEVRHQPQRLRFVRPVRRPVRGLQLNIGGY